MVSFRKSDERYAIKPPPPSLLLLLLLRYYYYYYTTRTETTFKEAFDGDW